MENGVHRQGAVGSQGRDPPTLFRENGEESPKGGFDRWKEVFKWSGGRRGCSRNRQREQNVKEGYEVSGGNGSAAEWVDCTGLPLSSQRV